MFTQWLNKRQRRKGPLWEDRFKRVLIEKQEERVKTMAAYIDLNPVRAGLVEDPKDYRWCGYAEAVAGNRPMSRGLKECCGKSLESHIGAPVGRTTGCGCLARGKRRLRSMR